jgi:predicted nucleic acid-binding protein
MHVAVATLRPIGHVKIVLDTNALESDRYAKRPVAEAAWRGAAAGDFELIIPEAVIGELVKHFSTALQDTLDQLDAALKKRKRELDTFGLDAPERAPIDVPALSAAYEPALRARCSEAGCRVEPNPDLRPALDWAVSRRKPFDASGHGLPDAAIWLTVLELAADDDVIVVTRNSKDFGKPGQLYPELRRDLSDRDIPEGRVRIVEDLFALRRDIVESAGEATSRIARLLEDPTTGPQLTERLVDAIRQSSIDPADAGLDFDVDEAPTLADLDVDGFAIVDAHELGDREILARLRTRGDAVLEMVVWRADYFDAEHDGVRLDPFDPEANAFDGELSISADVTIDAVIGLDGSVEEATIYDLERLPRHEEIQRRLDGHAGEQLVEELAHGGHALPPVSVYRPPEPIASAVEEATVEGWWRNGNIELEDILDRDPDGILLDIRVEASAAIRWIVSAPDAIDVERFRGIAEGVEDGGGYLHDAATDDPVVLHVTARLTPDGWEDVEIDDVTLRSEVLEERAAEALAAEGDLLDPFLDVDDNDGEDKSSPAG